MFLQAIFYSTLSFLQGIAAFLQVMGVFLPPIFYSTWASSRTSPPSSRSLGALLAHCLQHLGTPRRHCCASPRSKTSRVEMKVDYLSLCSRGSDNPAFIWFCDFLSKASRLSCDYSPRKKDQKKNKGRASKRRGRGMTSLKIVRPAFRGRACAPHLGAHAEYNAVRHWRKVVTPDPFQLLNF